VERTVIEVRFDWAARCPERPLVVLHERRLVLRHKAKQQDWRLQAQRIFDGWSTRVSHDCPDVATPPTLGFRA
jgi:hypothetical protein